MVLSKLGFVQGMARAIRMRSTDVFRSHDDSPRNYRFSAYAYRPGTARNVQKIDDRRIRRGPVGETIIWLMLIVNIILFWSN